MPDPINLDTLAAIRGVHAVWCFCGACRRSRKLDLERTAARVGWDFPITSLRERLRCQACGERAPEIRLVFDPADPTPYATGRES